MARPVKMMVLERCPHCKKAFEMMEQLKQQHPEYKQVEIEVIEEEQEPEKTEGYDYWYVPTFFVGDEKIMEGVPKIELVEKMFQTALADEPSLV